jgi:hypothetical protein
VGDGNEVAEIGQCPATVPTDLNRTAAGLATFGNARSLIEPLSATKSFKNTLQSRFFLDKNPHPS